jgi:hypothetical protein
MVLRWYGGVRYAFWGKECGASPQTVLVGMLSMRGKPALPCPNVRARWTEQAAKRTEQALSLLFQRALTVSLAVVGEQDAFVLADRF